MCLILKFVWKILGELESLTDSWN